jgi:membrane protein involved in colicin uptake
MPTKRIRKTKHRKTKRKVGKKLIKKLKIRRFIGGGRDEIVQRTPEDTLKYLNWEKAMAQKAEAEREARAQAQTQAQEAQAEAEPAEAEPAEAERKANNSSYLTRASNYLWPREKKT